MELMQEGGSMSFKTVNREHFKYLKNYYQPKDRAHFQNDINRYNKKFTHIDKEQMIADFSDIPITNPRIPVSNDNHKAA